MKKKNRIRITPPEDENKKIEEKIKTCREELRVFENRADFDAIRSGYNEYRKNKNNPDYCGELSKRKEEYNLYRNGYEYKKKKLEKLECKKEKVETLGEPKLKGNENSQMKKLLKSIEYSINIITEIENRPDFTSLHNAYKTNLRNKEKLDEKAKEYDKLCKHEKSLVDKLKKLNKLWKEIDDINYSISFLTKLVEDKDSPFNTVKYYVNDFIEHRCDCKHKHVINPVSRGEEFNRRKKDFGFWFDCEDRCKNSDDGSLSDEEQEMDMKNRCRIKTPEELHQKEIEREQKRRKKQEQKDEAKLQKKKEKVIAIGKKIKAVETSSDFVKLYDDYCKYQKMKREKNDDAELLKARFNKFKTYKNHKKQYRKLKSEEVPMAQPLPY